MEKNMKTYIKVIIAIMAIAIVGLSAGLVISLSKHEEKSSLEGLEILLNDDRLQDISEEDDEIKTYSVNLNLYNSFTLKYVATPYNLDDYEIMVTTAGSAVRVHSSSNINAGANGIVEFDVLEESENNEPVTITFKAIGYNNDEESIVAKCRVLVVKPSTLSKVVNIQYDGEVLKWDPVTSNTDGVKVVEAEDVRYEVSLSYGEGNNVVVTTKAGTNSFALDDVTGGFECGVVNKVTVKALGNNKTTTSSQSSNEYKFYILQSPTYVIENDCLKITSFDSNAKGVVEITDNNFSNFRYRQKGTESADWHISNFKNSQQDDVYSVELYSTLVTTKANYTSTFNSLEIDGINFFDSPASAPITIAYLKSFDAQMDNSNVKTISVKGQNVDTYGDTRITWDHATQDVGIRQNIRYLFTITSGDRSYSEMLSFAGETNPYIDLTNELLNKVVYFESGQNFNKTIDYTISIKAYHPMNEDDMGDETNAIRNGLYIVGSNCRENIEFTEYIPSISDFNITINDTTLTYSIPTATPSIKMIDEAELVFVSSEHCYTRTVTQSGEIKLDEFISDKGTYDLYIYARGNGKYININHKEIKKSDVYKTIGAPSNLQLSASGIMKFDAVDEADAYNIDIVIGNTTYTETVASNNDFDVIAYLENQAGGYNSVEANYSDEDNYYSVSCSCG